jgi:hypothetical protein
MREDHLVTNKKIVTNIAEYNIYKKSEEIKNCCLISIDLHKKSNNMISCTTCQCIIKVFIDETSCLRYLKFCQTQKRITMTTKTVGYWMVIFNPYKPIT